MKKLLGLIALVVLVLGLTGCGEEPKEVSYSMTDEGVVLEHTKTVERVDDGVLVTVTTKEWE